MCIIFLNFLCLKARTAPIINGSLHLNITVTKPFSASYFALDADGQAVTLNITGLPDGTTFNARTGIFSWNPTALTEVPNLR